MARIKLPNGETLAHGEVEALRLAFQGRTARESGDLLYVSWRTIHFRLEQAYKKLDVHRLMQAYRALEALGLLEQVMKEEAPSGAAMGRA